MNRLIFWVAVFVAHAQTLPTGLTETYQLEFLDSTATRIDFPLSGGFQSPFALVIRLDEDLPRQLILVNSGSRSVYRFELDSSGTPIFHERMAISDRVNRWLHLRDMDSDERIDLLTFDRFNNLQFYRGLGGFSFSSNPVFITDTTGAPIQPEFGNLPVIYDYDQDGRAEIYITTQINGFINRYEATSTPLIYRLTATRFGGVSVVGLAKQPGKKHGQSTFAFWDRDRDGDPDLLWGDQFQTHFYYLENVSTQDTLKFVQRDDRFNPDAIFNFEGTYHIPLITDLNSDTIPDLLVLSQQAERRTIQSFYGRDSGFISHRTDYIRTIDTGSNASIAITDLDMDGLDDLVISAYQGENNAFDLHFYRRQPITLTYQPFSFSGKIDWPWTSPFVAGFDVHIQDLNGDLIWDVLFVDENGNLRESINRGTRLQPLFTTVTTVLTGLGNFAEFELINPDNDGDLDLLVTQIQGRVFIYESRSTRFDTPTELTQLNNAEVKTIAKVTDSRVIILQRNDGFVQDLTIHSNMTVMLNKTAIWLPLQGIFSRLTLLDEDLDGILDVRLGTDNGGMLTYQGRVSTPLQLPNMLTIHPNPSSNEQTVTLPESVTIDKVQMMNPLGQTIPVSWTQVGRTVAIQIPNTTAAGLYIIEFVTLTGTRLYAKSLRLR